MNCIKNRVSVPATHVMPGGARIDPRVRVGPEDETGREPHERHTPREESAVR